MIGKYRRRGKQDLKRKSVGDYFRLGANIESHRIIPSVERADAPVVGTSSSRLAATELDTTRIGGDSVRICGENLFAYRCFMSFPHYRGSPLGKF